VTRLNFFLVVATILCALLLITSQYKARKLLNEFELEQDKTRQLDVEWGQLQLEQSTWATPGRIEKLAREKLHMLTPDLHRTVVVPVSGLPAPASVVSAPAATAPAPDSNGGNK
jgi:cell division protein FtsL